LRVLAVCHDAGGAELVAAWLRRQDARVALVLDGPARAVVERVLGPGLDVRDPFPDFTGFDLVLCGSSGEADLERRAVEAARGAGVRCAVYLDHWVNYALRFGAVLPDEVWVTDEHAARLAAEALPGVDVRIQGNPYVEDAAAEVAAIASGGDARSGGERVLYVTEPTPTAPAALAGYLELLAQAPPAALRLRRHPAEPPHKYRGELAAFAGRLPLSDSPGGTLAEDIAWADTVVGCDTMAMVVALYAGRRVIAVEAPGARPLSLPFPEIERVSVQDESAGA
jgi:hypothetical protein